MRAGAGQAVELVPTRPPTLDQFSQREWNVPSSTVNEAQSFQLPHKYARNLLRIYVSPLGHICTFVANETICCVFHSSWSVALMVIN